MNEQTLLNKARKAMQNAYAPYSGYKVGAALLAEDGRIYTGANVENASFSAGMCAERIAIFKAINDGNNKFQALAIYAQGENLPYPCGICRQVISEFCQKLKIIIARDKKKFVIKRFSELFPDCFKLN